MKPNTRSIISPQVFLQIKRQFDMIRQAKWFILLLIVKSGFEEVYDAKKHCDGLYKTSQIPKIIFVHDLASNYGTTDVLLNTSFIVKTPSPGATAYICLNSVVPHEHSLHLYSEVFNEELYCILYTGSFIKFEVKNKEVPAICSKRFFLRNRGSWFATNLVLYTGKNRDSHVP